jgi:hypothetical protein
VTDYNGPNWRDDPLEHTPPVRRGELERTLRDLLNAFDDGVKSCTGVLSSGELVWKGSFICYMERLRSLLPEEKLQ